MSLPINANPNALAHVKPDTTTKSPAKAAREYLTANPDVAEQPFGKLVSQFAKGESPSA